MRKNVCGFTYSQLLALAERSARKSISRDLNKQPELELILKLIENKVRMRITTPTAQSRRWRKVSALSY